VPLIRDFLDRILHRPEAPEPRLSRRACPTCNGQMRYIPVWYGTRVCNRVCDDCGYIDPVAVKMRNPQPFIDED